MKMFRAGPVFFNGFSVKFPDPKLRRELISLPPPHPPRLFGVFFYSGSRLLRGGGGGGVTY